MPQLQAPKVTKPFLPHENIKYLINIRQWDNKNDIWWATNTTRTWINNCPTRQGSHTPKYLLVPTLLEQSCCREVSFESSGPIGQVGHLLIHVIFIFLPRQSPSWLGSTVVLAATQRAGSSTRKTRHSSTMLSTLLTSLRLGSSPPLLMT